MKYPLPLVVFTLVCSVPSAAMADKFNSDFLLTLVSSADDVTFNIASDLTGAQTPNVLSELKMLDMTTWSLEGDLNLGLGDSFKIGIRAGIGAIIDGNANSRDYLGNNRTNVFYDVVATVDGKYRLYGDANIGWQFSNSFEVPIFHVGKENKMVALASTISVTPRIGYSYYEQEIDLDEGVQLVPALGPFEGLNSTYQPEWRGIYASLEGSFRLFGSVHLLATARYYPDLSYQGDADFNLRGDLAHPVSTHHSADGTGFSYEIGLEWQFDVLRGVALSYGEQSFETDTGYSHIYPIDSDEIVTRLNEATWDSKGWLLQLRWRFGA